MCIRDRAVTRTYRSLWRYASIGEVMRVLGGTLLGMGATYLFAILITAVQRANTQIPFMEYMLGLVGNSVRIAPNLSLIHIW